jgi:hypothetical protein
LEKKKKMKNRKQGTKKKEAFIMCTVILVFIKTKNGPYSLFVTIIKEIKGN